MWVRNKHYANHFPVSQVTAATGSEGLMGKRHDPLCIEWSLEQFNLVSKGKGDARKQEKNLTMFR